MPEISVVPTALFMYRRILLLLNIKPHESALVRKLFTVQFFLGIATAFYFTSTLAMFLSTYKIDTLPLVYIFSAVALMGFNRVYAYLDEKLNSPRLLEIVILFSASAVLLFWILLTFLDFHSLKLIISASYMIIYMLVGYAFWGMASIMFNIRESKRLFSIVGAGDIPAKMLGYFSVSALIHVMSIYNLLWVSIGSFIIAFLLMKRYQNQGFIVANDPNEPHDHISEDENISVTKTILKRFFYNRLILYIAILSVVAYVVFAFIDFTFLADIKEKYKKGEQMATFIAIFFAVGRIFAIAIKLLFSSRMIARIGLTNSLLVTPVLLLIICLVIILSDPSLKSHLLIFGFMVLLTEVLRSALQEPVFFILFQPLPPHDRLRGHLVAKGYTMPFALMGVGTFLYFFMKKKHEMPITLVAQILIVFLIFWIVAVLLIKKQYLRTLINSLKKGYFTGTELFLNDDTVINSLVSKAKSSNPLEVIHALNLLERSGYKEIYALLLKNLSHTKNEVKEYVLSRIINNNMTSALALIEQQIQDSQNEKETHPELIKAYYFLEKDLGKTEPIDFNLLSAIEKKSAIIGLLHRHDEEIETMVLAELENMTQQHTAEKLLVLDIITETSGLVYTQLLKTLLLDKHSQVYKKAIEAVGKLKDYNLFNETIEVAVKHHAYAALQRSLLYYGDEVFSKDYWDASTIPDPLITTIIKTTGKIKGEESSKFLFTLLVSHPKYADAVIDSLWLKKASPQGIDKKNTDAYIQHKIEQTKVKILYYNDLITLSALGLLKEAIGRELKYDLHFLLKAFAIQFDRPKVDRVIELLQLDNKARIYNAIEVLELILPGKYFNQLNILVELMNDIEEDQVLLPRSHDLKGIHIIEEVLKDNKANFSEWTRSVACFMIPKLNKNDFSLQLLKSKVVKEEVLFNETRNYVLSMLK